MCVCLCVCDTGVIASVCQLIVESWGSGEEKETDEGVKRKRRDSVEGRGLRWYSL